jgi:hypothetical protein
MKLIALITAFALCGCSTVTLNGQDITRGLTFTAIGAVAIAALAADDDGEHVYGIPEDGCAECTLERAD